MSTAHYGRAVPVGLRRFPNLKAKMIKDSKRVRFPTDLPPGFHIVILMFKNNHHWDAGTWHGLYDKVSQLVDHAHRSILKEYEGVCPVDDDDDLPPFTPPKLYYLWLFGRFRWLWSYFWIRRCRKWATTAASSSKEGGEGQPIMPGEDRILVAYTDKVSKKRKFVADGVFYAELNELLTTILAEDGYSGVEVRVTPIKTEIIIRATRTREVLGEKGRRIRELTALVERRFDFPENSVELFAERVDNRALCAQAQAESLRYKLLGGLPVRRAAYGVLRFVMENGAKGVEVTVSGKLRAQRAKVMKFADGYLLSTGTPKEMYVDQAIRNVDMRQGILGIRVKIMMAYDPEGKSGPKTRLPDDITIHEPKEDTVFPVEAAATAEEQPTEEQQQQPTEAAAAEEAPAAVEITA
ncbi:40S ribosomal protein S3 [Perkinsus olseni]|uniref:30S ribosomal protein S3, chloroplastic n=1 Tax=Perkinsus olseni TaxID=32597 RepID=A0A7J6LDC6_PEROL|nr:40S ribosomal protein S3 [Perkinsus olseni]